MYPKTYLYKRIVQAKLFMDANFAEDIELDNIAGESYFSKFHFIRLFKSIYGKTPHQYLTLVRMDKAKSFLQKGVTVSDVCFSTGFDSISSFIALFKRNTGLTPSAYQQFFQQRQKKLSASPLNFIPNCFAQEFGWTKK